MSSPERQSYDVVVFGGGLAGLTLARHLKLRSPGLSLLVAERRTFPAPEAAFKVGESSVEIGAHYFGRILGLADYLDAEQLPKFGLRFFFGAGDNEDIARRVEVGSARFPLVPSYQLDRGRFENALAKLNQEAGIEIADGCSVAGVEIGSPHRVTLSSGGSQRQVEARWIVDASGRGSVLKHRLDLGQDNGHDVNAIWFRIEDRVDIDEWSQEPAWRARIPGGSRYLSTNHLMGPGYWVWLIPLSSGTTSIGIVADAALHPVTTFNRFDKALDWLWRHEPQCAREIEARRDQLMDFRSLRHYAHGCKQVYSAQRWCLTGEAGVFNDPFYSPGSDLIAISNGFIVDLILRDQAGEDVAGRCAHYNRAFLNIFEMSLVLYQDLYLVIGEAQVMTAKVMWDNVTYWGVTALLYFRNKLLDLDFMASIGKDLWRFGHLGARVQRFFLDWTKRSSGSYADAFVNMLGMDFARRLQEGLAAELDDDELRRTIRENIAFSEEMARQIFVGAVKRCLGISLEGREINPYAIGLEPASWEIDGLFTVPAPEGPLPDLSDLDLEPMWLQPMDQRHVAKMAS